MRGRVSVAIATGTAVGSVSRRGLWRPVVLGGFVVFMIVPLLATVLFSVSTRWDRTLWPEGFTLAWWGRVTGRAAFQETLLNSLVIALTSVAGAVLLVTPAAYWARLRAPRARPWIEFLAIVPFGLPGVVLALGLLRFYANVPLRLVNTSAILVAAYLVQQGEKPRDAIARIRKLRPGSIETTEQSEAIVEFGRRRKRE